jgi:aspartyl-tRNA(Asn)/glutamyl-tRNA(Gln) amidotransferase subunit A
VLRVKLTGIEDAAYAALAIIWPEVSSQQRVEIRSRSEEYDQAARSALYMGELLPTRLYVLAQRSRTHFTQQVLSAMSAVDVLALPTCADTAGPLVRKTAPPAREEIVRDMLRLIRYTVPFNVTGFPAISVPCGLDRDGLPVGLQLVARPYHEDLLIHVAEMYEGTRPWTFPPPPAS